MLTRIVLALVGASLITVSLLLGMNEVAETLRLRDPTRFFRISDVIVQPGRWRPDRPPTPERPPERTAPTLDGAPQSLTNPEAPGRPERPSLPLPDAAPLDLPEEHRE